jgi:hypothetical protein
MGLMLLCVLCCVLCGVEGVASLCVCMDQGILRELTELRLASNGLGDSGTSTLAHTLAGMGIILEA